MIYLFLLVATSARLGVAMMPPGHTPQTEVAFANQTLFYREDAGTFNATLLLSGSMQDGATISIAVLTTSPNVRAGEDFSPDVFEDIVVPATNSSSVNIRIELSIIDDDVLEDYEAFLLVASVVGNENQTSTLSVVIEDFGDNVVVDFEEEKQQIVILESAGVLMVCVRIANGSTEGELSIQVMPDSGTASSVTDYINPISNSLTLTETVTRDCLSLPVYKDSVVEDEETLTIYISAAFAIDLPRPNITGVIQDVNGALVAFYDSESGMPATSYEVEERDENFPFKICLQLLLPGPEPTERPVRAFITTPDSAQDNGTGFTFKSSGNVVLVTNLEVVFLVGSTNETVACKEVEIIGDLEAEPTTFFVANLSLENANDAIAGESIASVVIQDNDAVQCEALPDPAQGGVAISDEERVVGSEARYSCQGGFMLVGDTVRVCEDSGNWTGSNPSCKPETFIPPVTVDLGDETGFLDTMFIIGISAGAGGLVMFLIVIIICVCFVRKKYKYSQKYYCQRVDIRVKKKETYTTSSMSHVSNVARRQPTIAIPDMAVVEESDEGSTVSGPGESINGRRLSTASPTSGTSSFGHFRTQQRSINEGISSGGTEINQSEHAILQLADTSHTIANKSYNESELDTTSFTGHQDDYHITEDLNSNLNNNVVQDNVSVSILIENPILGTTEVLQGAYTIEPDSLHLSDIEAQIDASQTDAGTMREKAKESQAPKGKATGSRGAVYV